MGTKETILTLRHMIEKNSKKGKATIVSFVDLEKAFDYVSWYIIFGLIKNV